MKKLITIAILLLSLNSWGQTFNSPYYPNQGAIINFGPSIPTKKVERIVIDRFELLSIKYDNREVRELDSLSRTDSYLRKETSYRVVFEMPGLHFQQRLHSDTLEITNFESVHYIKIGNKIYSIKP